MRLRIALHAVGVQRGRKWVLRDLTLDVRPGERWALIGANGAGKTQLLKLLAGVVWPTPTAAGRRTYHLGRQEVDLIEAKSRIVYLGAEMQDKYARYGWDLTVSDLIATGLHRTDLLLSPVTAPERRKIEATLRACGLKRLAGRRLSTLSYGQKRLALLGSRALPGSGLVVARRALQRTRCELSPPHRSRARRGASRAAAHGSSRFTAPAMCRAARAASSSSRPADSPPCGRCSREGQVETSRGGRRGRATRAHGRAVRAARAGSRHPPLVKIRDADLYVGLQAGAARALAGSCARASTGRCSGRTARARAVS